MDQSQLQTEGSTVSGQIGFGANRAGQWLLGWKTFNDLALISLKTELSVHRGVTFERRKDNVDVSSYCES